MSTNHFTDSQIQLALEHLRQFEQGHLSDPVHGFNNPFRRPGVTAADLAFTCGFLKEGTTKSGRVRVDTSASRRLAKYLVASGLVERTGSYRTRSAGSKELECFALAGFHARLEAAQEAWLQSVAHRHSK